MTRWFWKLLGYADDSGRQLFRFFDGSRVRHVDPIDAWNRLSGAAGDDWPDTLRLIAKLPPAGVFGAELKAYRQCQHDAAVKVADAVCEAFGVGELVDNDDGTVSGLTAGERIALAASFVDFMGGLARRATPFASSPPPTAACPPA